MRVSTKSQELCSGYYYLSTCYILAWCWVLVHIDESSRRFLALVILGGWGDTAENSHEPFGVICVGQREALELMGTQRGI